MKKTLVCLTVAAVMGWNLAAMAEESCKSKGESKEKAGCTCKKGPSEEMIKKYDKDADGKLSDEEKATCKADMKTQKDALIKKYDKDADGKLSNEEKTEEFKKEMQALHGGNQKCESCKAKGNEKKAACEIKPSVEAKTEETPAPSSEEKETE